MQNLTKNSSNSLWLIDTVILTLNPFQCLTCHTVVCCGQDTLQPMQWFDQLQRTLHHLPKLQIIEKKTILFTDLPEKVQH